MCSLRPNLATQNPLVATITIIISSMKLRSDDSCENCIESLLIESRIRVKKPTSVE